MALNIGLKSPNFTATSTKGEINFHSFIQQKWTLLFAFPQSFHPVCTTEAAELASKAHEFQDRDIQIIALSPNTLEELQEWTEDIEDLQSNKLNFPILSDTNSVIANAFDILNTKSQLTRAVFLLDPKGYIRLALQYPNNTGRNFEEVLRMIDSITISEHHKIATPVNWRFGDKVYIQTSVKDLKEIKAQFPNGFKEIKPYMRITVQPKT